MSVISDISCILEFCALNVNTNTSIMTVLAKEEVTLP